MVLRTASIVFVNLAMNMAEMTNLAYWCQNPYTVFQAIALRMLSEKIAEPREFEPELTDLKLVEFYRLMLLTRVFDNQALSLQRQGRVGFYVTSEGEEAAEIGSAMAFDLEDWLFIDYRSSGVVLSRGMPISKMFAQLLGSADDILKGRSMPAHWGCKQLNIVPPSSPICTQLPQAVGAALGAKLRGEKKVTAAYFGDGGTSSNDFHSGMNFASVFKTPTIFFCRNNGYAISVPLSKQTASDSLAIKSVAYGMEGVQVDGNDVLAVYGATKRAVTKGRADLGPTLIEAVTYRMGPHTTSDDPSRYRQIHEVESMKEKDPIQRFKKYLMESGRWDESRNKELEQALTKQVKEAFSQSEAIAKPTVRSLFDDVYAESTLSLQRQADELAGEVGE